MTTFAYRAIDGSGLRRTGRAVAATAQDLIASLAVEGLVVLEVSKRDAQPLQGRGFRHHRKSLIEATRAIAGLLTAGLPLSRALNTAKSMTASPYRECLEHVHQAVARGETLAGALSAHSGLFPPFYIGLVRAGERSAELPATFTRLATQLERDDDLRSRLGAAAIYPAILAVVGSIAILVLMLFVLPRFAAVLEGAGAHLPRSTELLLAFATALRTHWLVALSPLLGVPIALAWITTTDAGAIAWARMQLSLPIVRTLRGDIIAARVARLMSVLLAGGTPALGALDNVAASLSDPLARTAVLQVRAHVREGARVSTALRATELFPPLLPQLAALGEETGQLHEFLRKAADLFEQRSERAIARLVALAEPTMIVMLAVVVGSVALSLLQAIYGVNASAFR